MSALVIHTKGKGYLGDTSTADVAQIAAQVAAAERATIHIHGGLVSKSLGLAGAERLNSFYRAAGVLPVFPVWESALFETIGNNWKEIFNEKLFQALLKCLLKHAGGKLLQSPGGRSMQVYEPLTELEARQALIDATDSMEDRSHSEPLADVIPIEPLTQLTDEEIKPFAEELKSQEFQNAVDSIMLGMQVRPRPGERASTMPIQPESTHLSPAIRDELTANASPGARGLFSTAILIKHAVAILARIIERFVKKRGHGFYTTVVEELLRGLYFHAAGGGIWGTMKKDTNDTFDEDGAGAPRGGALFLCELAAQLRAQAGDSKPFPRISLVAHSAGSLWLCHFLRHLAALREGGAIPAAFRIDKVIFMAPACTCSLFTETLARHAVAPLFNEFRMFALSDPLEAGYWEAPPLYPRSLLYLVSGLFEDEADKPLVGMQRFVTGTIVYNSGDVQAVRAFLSLSRERSIWSCEDRGPGLASDTFKHGEFDSTDSSHSIKTMQSVAHILKM